MLADLMEKYIGTLAGSYQISPGLLLTILAIASFAVYCIRTKIEELVANRINQALEEYKKNIKKEIIDYGYSRQKQSKYYRRIYGLIFKGYYEWLKTNADISKIDVSGWNNCDVDNCISELKITDKERMALKELWKVDDKDDLKKELCRLAYISFCKSFFKQISNLNEYYYSRKLYFSNGIQNEISEILKMYNNLYKISAQRQESEAFYDEQSKKIMKKINNLEKIMKEELYISDQNSI